MSDTADGARGQKQSKPSFEILEHPADVGFVAYGATREELFQNAAAAVLELACETSGIAEREQRELAAEGDDIDALLFGWLAEILAVMDAEGVVFRRASVIELTEHRVRGIGHGERFDRARHRAGTYIKAVTYHQFRVEKTENGWTARVFLDV